MAWGRCNHADYWFFGVDSILSVMPRDAIYRFGAEEGPHLKTSIDETMRKAHELAHSNLPQQIKDQAAMQARGESGRFIKRQLPDRSVLLIDTHAQLENQTIATIPLPDGPEDPKQVAAIDALLMLANLGNDVFLQRSHAAVLEEEATLVYRIIDRDEKPVSTMTTEVFDGMRAGGSLVGTQIPVVRTPKGEEFRFGYVTIAGKNGTPDEQMVELFRCALHHERKDGEEVAVMNVSVPKSEMQGGA